MTQSGGLINDVWLATLNQLKPSPKSTWLVLGIAGGTVAKIISRRFSPTSITGVDIDKVMLQLGKKYLHLETIPNLSVVNSSADAYLKKVHTKFDYILVDLYIGDHPPEFVYTRKFLQDLSHHLNQSGAAVINHLFYDQPKKTSAQNLVHLLSDYFLGIKLYRKLTNLFIICSQPRKPV